VTVTIQARQLSDSALVGTVAYADLSWTRRSDDAGSARCKAPIGTSPSLLTDTVYYRVLLDGAAVFGWVADRPTRTHTDGGVGLDLSGRGLRGLLDRIVILPPDCVPPATELHLGWMDVDLDTSGWAAAASWGTVASQPFATYRPAGFPDDTAEFVAPDTSLHQAYRWRARSAVFQVPDDGPYLIATSSDDHLQAAFLNGVALDDLTSREVFGWKTWEHGVTVELCAGQDYVLACDMENLDRVVANPTWVLATVMSFGDDGLPDTVIANTGTDWLVEDGTTPSGPTPGQVVSRFLAEAAARGTLPATFTEGFTGVLDSAGNAWSTVNLTVPVGDTIEDLLGLLARAGVQAEVRPDLTIDLWEGRGADLTATVALTSGSNVSGVKRDELRDTTRNVLHVLTGDGQITTVTDATSVAARGRREGWLDMSTYRDFQACSGLVAAELAELSTPPTIYTWDTVDALGPSHGDYDLADIIDVDGEHVRVLEEVGSAAPGGAVTWQYKAVD